MNLMILKVAKPFHPSSFLLVLIALHADRLRLIGKISYHSGRFGAIHIHSNGEWGIPFEECLQAQGGSTLSCGRRIQSASGRRWTMNGFG
jgi:hypothetical protein